MLRLAEGKLAQVSLSSALPVDVAGTCFHASLFAGQALEAVTKNQRTMMVVETGGMFINQKDMEKFALQPAHRQTPVLPHLAPS